jgi:hypothetical protein
MSLPIKIRNVQYYRIAGKYIFAGDLFITRGTIYFFPEIDLEEQRNAAAGWLPHDLAIVVHLVMYISQKFGSYSPRTDFWRNGISNEQLTASANIYVEKLKANKRIHPNVKAMPLPTVVSVPDVSAMTLSLTGRLSFSALSDTHDFNVGPRRKKQLREAIWEGGFDEFKGRSRWCLVTLGKDLPW